MAAEYGDHIFVMSSGTLVCEGDPHEVFTCDIIREVFGVESQMSKHPVSGKPMCIPIRNKHMEVMEAAAVLP